MRKPVMKIGQDKYLILRTPEKSAGLDRILLVIKGAIKEAIHLKRILVIDQCTMHERYNLGHKLSFDIERYINLNKTRIYKIGDNGSIKQLDNPLRFVRAKDFDYNKYPEELVLQLSSITPISETQNNRYQVIARTTIDEAYYRLVYPDALIIALSPSDRVVYLTDMVLQAMGTNLSDAKKLAAIHRGIDFSTNRDTWQNAVLDSRLHYVCMHIRGNDMSKYASYKQALSSSHIGDIINRKIPKGMKIYIMTDITEPGYLNFLEKDYTVYQYYHFPELKKLVSGVKSPIDNAMLYSVEKNIMQHAYVKLVRTDEVSRVIYTHCIYKVLWRYRVLSVIDSSLKAIRSLKAKITELIRVEG